MTTIEPTIFHKYLHVVFIFAQITQAQTTGEKDVKNGNEQKKRAHTQSIHDQTDKKSDENHTELSSVNR